MKGKIKFSAKNVHIRFQFELERNITIITGDSGTGKTTLINMVRQYSELGKQSGVTLSCDKKCVVLEGINWESNLEKISDSIVFVEESTSFLNSHKFAAAINGTDNYYVIISREPLAQLPYSVDSIKHIVKKGKNPQLMKSYADISVKRISDFPYEVVIVEDEQSGYQFFCKATEGRNIECISAKGKTGILGQLKKYAGKSTLVIADAAALGSEIRELESYKALASYKIDFYLPESFEWLILNSSIFVANKKISAILANPIEYIECSEFLSWERYFEYLLVNETKDSKDLKYSKHKIAKGYITDKRIEMILASMDK